jgi:hypothetical protein
MNKLPSRVRRRNGRAPSLPLLDYIDRASVRALPLPARRLAHRFGLSVAMAHAVAIAAGFNCEGER